MRDFKSAPHTAIVGAPLGAILMLIDREAGGAQRALLEISRTAPGPTLTEARKLVMQRHHEVRSENVHLKRLGAVLAMTYEREFQDFAGLLLMEKLGPRTLLTLAMIAGVVHERRRAFPIRRDFRSRWAGRTGIRFRCR